MNFPILPYSPIIIDAKCHHFYYAVSKCLSCHDNTYRSHVKKELLKLWTTDLNKNNVLPLLSVRTGLDLYLTALNFPKGSEMIMTAVNIPDMSTIVKHHGLVIVPLDISLDTLEPKLELLDKLITTKTVGILVAHLYGRVIPMDNIIVIAKQKNLIIIEDCAESFNGFTHIGNPLSDISLFSFGVIKFYTSFGGCIAKVRDQNVYKKMCDIQQTYPLQTADIYFKKVLKYLVIFSWLQISPLPKIGRIVLNQFGVDYKALFVKWMRGFPDQMLKMIRCQPSTALLATMLYRQRNFNQTEFDLQKQKAEYFFQKLPLGFKPVGMKADINNFWLCPVLVDSPDEVVKQLNLHGVDAYRGATQLKNIEPCDEIAHRFTLLDGISSKETRSTSLCYPHEAKYLIEHVIYLPVSKFVPFDCLDNMLKACAFVMKTFHQSVPRVQGKLLKSKL
ncbi:CAunnamed protein product [Biomphalaria glabrata]|uniref:Uncharacterized protein n=1 Tax=Biomphalaria glabrata TaxID=6526 RepID=A0A2C9JUP6_BIOGL|nr:CAunnamed protein product [Biomphalaria glabrata]